VIHADHFGAERVQIPDMGRHEQREAGFVGQRNGGPLRHGGFSLGQAGEAFSTAFMHIFIVKKRSMSFRDSSNVFITPLGTAHPGNTACPRCFEHRDFLTATCLCTSRGMSLVTAPKQASIFFSPVNFKPQTPAFLHSPNNLLTSGLPIRLITILCHMRIYPTFSMFG
jgi:hypothetical protein